MNKTLSRLACAGLIGIVLTTLSGCAYLNGDAMWIGSDQKSVCVSNTLMTLTETEYKFKEDNLPFCFTCKPSSTSYDFIVDLETNSVFKIRICTKHNNVSQKDDAVIAVCNGMATISGGLCALEWQRWDNPDCRWKKCGTSISQCKEIRLSICPRHGRCLVYASSAAYSYFLEVDYRREKLCKSNSFIIEECSDAKLRHLSNWYDW